MCAMYFTVQQGGFDKRDDYIGFMKERVKANQSLSSALHFVDVAGKRYRQFDDVTDRLELLGRIARTSLDDERRPPDLQQCVQAFSSITLYVNELRKVIYRCGSVVECRARNRESLGSNPPFATVSKFGHFNFLHNAPIHSAV